MLESVALKVTLDLKEQTDCKDLPDLSGLKVCKVSVVKTDNLDLVENEENKDLLAYLVQSDRKGLLV